MATAKKASKVLRRKPATQAQTAPAASAQPVETATYEVLTPFKLRGELVRPPLWVELSEDEAEELIEAGVIGADPVEPVLSDDAQQGQTQGEPQ